MRLGRSQLCLSQQLLVATLSVTVQLTSPPPRCSSLLFYFIFHSMVSLFWTLVALKVQVNCRNYQEIKELFLQYHTTQIFYLFKYVYFALNTMYYSCDRLIPVLNTLTPSILVVSTHLPVSGLIPIWKIKKRILPVLWMVFTAHNNCNYFEWNHERCWIWQWFNNSNFVIICCNLQ